MLSAVCFTQLRCTCRYLKLTDVLLLRPGMGAKHCDQRVCMYVCLSVCPLALSQKPHAHILPSFLYMLSVRLGPPQTAMRLCCVLSFFLDVVMFSMEGIGRIKHDEYVSSSSPDGDTSRTSDNVVWSRVEIAKWRHWGKVCRIRLHLVLYVCTGLF